MINIYKVKVRLYDILDKEFYNLHYILASDSKKEVVREITEMLTEETHLEILNIKKIKCDALIGLQLEGY